MNPVRDKNQSYHLNMEISNNVQTNGNGKIYSKDEQIFNNAGLKYLPHWPSVNIDFNELVYSVPDVNKVLGRKPIIRNVTGQFRSGELTAIMGASGSGKTTLLNLLAGFKIQHDSGQIYINGNSRNMRYFKKICRYIMQNEELDQYYTVRESMMLAAHLKLGKSLSMSEKNEIINEILENLRLQKAENTINSRLSGGEKKRLSIAMELLNNPPVIFLDEPTTGLDDMSGAQCMKMLKRLASGGRTIICSIHTPSARLFQLFDNVYVLSDGQCVYQGSVGEIVPFVKSIGLTCPITYNPADFIIEVSCGEYGREYCDRMINTVENGKCIKWLPSGNSRRSEEIRNDIITTKKCGKSFNVDKDLKNFNSGATWWQTFCILWMRMILRMWRDKSYMKLKFYMHIILIFIIGGMYVNAGIDATKALFNYGFSFTIMFAYVYLPLMPILASFPTELRLVRREYFNQWYQLGPYYCAMMLSKIPFMLFLGIIYITSVYLMTSQPLEIDRFIKLFSIAITTGLVSDSLGVIIGSRFNIVNGQFIGPVVLTPMIILAGYGFGFGIKQISLHMRIIMNFSYLRHSLLGVMAALYSNNRGDTICPDDEIFSMACKKDRIYQTCGPAVELTCSNNPTGIISNICNEGCFCPKGNKNKCISIEQCPCTLRNKEFQNGSIIQKDCNSCVCKSGIWKCSNNLCDARCSAIGGLHFETFDGKQYNFIGKCSYYLLKTVNVSIIAENLPLIAVADRG